MTLSELIAQFRLMTVDTVSPFLWDDSDVLTFLNNAVDEAAVRADLIYDNSTTAVCEITLASGTATYTLDSSISRVLKAYIIDDGDIVSLYDIDRIELDRVSPGWRADDDDKPEYIILDETSIQIHPAPSSDYDATTLYLEVYRETLTAEKMSFPDDSPVISSMHHRYLYHWALHEAYAQADVEMYDLTRSEQALARFEQYFGKRPGADRKRRSMTNRPHRNKLW